MKYIDIHCHLDFSEYYKEDGDEIGGVLERMKENGVGAISIGTDLESSKRAVKIAEENDNVWACIGVHPVEFPSLDQGEGRVGFDEEEFEKLVASPKVVGIGECGLDYFRTKDPERQIPLFKQQIEFALKHDKMLMLHCRNAYDETLDILKEYKKQYGDKLRGNSHFFAGNVDQANKFVNLGFSCSFTGVITFTQDYDEVIRSLPQNMIMSETDSPFVAPVPYRGKRNEPSFVVEVVKKIAQIRGESEGELALAIMHNAERMFGIKLLE